MTRIDEPARGPRLEPGTPPPTGPMPLPGDRRRPGWREFRHAFPGILATMTLAILVLVAMDSYLIYKRTKYHNEIARLRAGMTDVERRQTDMALRADENRFKVMLELIRRQARTDAQLHLSISVDSSTMYLEQGQAQLRVMPVQVGPEAWIGTAPDTVKLAAPRGQRTVERVLGPKDAFEIPKWVYQQRGLPVPAERTLSGALGPSAVVLSGGTVIYSMPTVGPLNDSAYVMPGSIRARTQDLRAMLPNLKAGQTVYFY